MRSVRNDYDLGFPGGRFLSSLEWGGSFAKAVGLIAALGGCAPIDDRDRVAQILREHPEIILQSLPSHEIEIFELVQRDVTKQEERARQQQRLAELANPFQPVLDGSRPQRGNTEAPITIVEYSDFQCPFCRQASPTVQQVLAQYKGRVRFFVSGT